MTDVHKYLVWIVCWLNKLISRWESRGLLNEIEYFVSYKYVLLTSRQEFSAFSRSFNKSWAARINYQSPIKKFQTRYECFQYWKHVLCLHFLNSKCCRRINQFDNKEMIIYYTKYQDELKSPFEFRETASHFCSVCSKIFNMSHIFPNLRYSSRGK